MVSPRADEAAQDLAGVERDHRGQDGVERGRLAELEERGLRRGPHADEHTRHKGDHDADRERGDRELEVARLPGGQPVLKEMGEHTGGERDERVGQELELTHVALPHRARRHRSGDFRIGYLRIEDPASGFGHASQVVHDDHERHPSHDHEDQRLHRVGPRRRAHAADEHVDEDDHADDPDEPPPRR